jgi:hypothetical protein
MLIWIRVRRHVRARGGLGLAIMLGPSSTGRCVVGGQVDPEDAGASWGMEGLDTSLATGGDAGPPAPPKLRYAKSQRL